MAVLANAKHERFAQAIAQGKTATEAMELAGYSDPRNSTRLTKKDEIRTRIAELQNAGSLRVEVTIASLIEEAAEIQKAAKDAGQHSAAVAALTAKAKLAGLWIDKAENTNRNVADPTAVSDAELAAVIEAGRGAGTAASKADPSKLN